MTRKLWVRCLVLFGVFAFVGAGIGVALADETVSPTFVAPEDAVVRQAATARGYANSPAGDAQYAHDMSNLDATIDDVANPTVNFFGPTNGSSTPGPNVNVDLNITADPGVAVGSSWPSRFFGAGTFQLILDNNPPSPQGLFCQTGFGFFWVRSGTCANPTYGIANLSRGTHTLRAIVNDTTSDPITFTVT